MVGSSQMMSLGTDLRLKKLIISIKYLNDYTDFTWGIACMRYSSKRAMSIVFW